MRFASWLYRIAGIYGLVVLVPQYFMENQLNEDYPPVITHPEHFYGFLGVATAWQVAFLLIAHDPARYRLFMIPAVLEKFSFGIAVAVLYVQERVPGLVLVFGILDLVWGMLFLLAFWRTAPHSRLRPWSAENQETS